MKKELRISAIKEGTVIDHIPAQATFKVVEILNLAKNKDIVSVATNLKSKALEKKGIVKVGGKELTKKEVDEIAIVAPQATINIIKDYDVIKKSNVELPAEFDNIIRCSNPVCITNNEKVKTLFHVVNKAPLEIKCHHCERVMGVDDIILI
ncbi:aspartate carbamoyltransferase regulatory subunit [Candidatus Woesearchaeota archaeon]|nr:aspartate carbamoyltransferase regulatory subunit [Candidatus Woesearchaeota archaeon]